MDSGVTGLCESLDVEKGSSFSTFNLIETLKHLLLWAHGSNLLLNIKVILSAVSKRRNGTGEGKARKYCGGVGWGGGRGAVGAGRDSGSRAREFGVLRSVLVEFLAIDSHKSLYLLRVQYT